ncbi:hypothetical protein HGRIS_010529 [Hohenbuehelia grisea]|uniref:Uncharacterized protein n=1 Tax=Hohenbuehelia grisea TaxID=104357 RepID=A0ABR3IX56_9AGAR
MPEPPTVTPELSSSSSADFDHNDPQGLTKEFLAEQFAESVSSCDENELELRNVLFGFFVSLYAMLCPHSNSRVLLLDKLLVVAHKIVDSHNLRSHGSVHLVLFSDMEFISWGLILYPLFDLSEEDAFRVARWLSCIEALGKVNRDDGVCSIQYELEAMLRAVSPKKLMHSSIYQRNQPRKEPARARKQGPSLLRQIFKPSNGRSTGRRV